MAKFGSTISLPVEQLKTTNIKLNAHKITFYIVVIMLCFEVLGGPLRVGLSAIGFVYLIYLPKTMMFVTTVYFITLRRNLNVKMYSILFLLIFSMAINLYELQNPFQTFFELWSVAPFFFGLLASQSVLSNIKSYKFSILALYVAALSGVFINEFIDFPWSGTAITIAGQAVSVSINWNAGNYSRISGFSRASYDAACQLLVLAIVILSLSDALYLKFVVWILAGGGILLTTTKGVFYSYVSISGYFIALRFFRYFGKKAITLVRFFLSMLLFFLTFLDIYLPLSSISTRYSLGLKSPFETLLFASFEDRLSYTWPNELRYLTNSFQWIFGDGIGAIGAGQSLVTTSDAWPGDNLFVFLVVQFGILGSMILYGFLCWKFVSLIYSKERSVIVKIGVPVLIFIITYGLTDNILEEPIAAFLFGVVFAGKIKKAQPIPRCAVGDNADFHQHYG